MVCIIRGPFELDIEETVDKAVGSLYIRIGCSFNVGENLRHKLSEINGKTSTEVEALFDKMLVPIEYLIYEGLANEIANGLVLCEKL